MKKYKLKLKNPSQNFKFDSFVKHDGCYHMLKWLVGDSDMPYSYSQSEKYAKQFTQEEIDSLPHGLVKLHEIIEVEEQLYYIRIPYGDKDNSFLCEPKNEHEKLLYADNSDGYGYKTKFTLDEVKKHYPLYANDTFLVKVEEIVE